MSAKIWQELQTSVRNLRPDLAQDFTLCRDRSAIVSFMNTHFPLTEQMVGKGKTDWDVHLTAKIPDILKENNTDPAWKKPSA